ncbi:MAG: NUDIX domain-containing protein [Acholeplasmatales bacterium]|nr:MAG: NUDIX domain-containing protein [Acholeplasmatales bacterium]
MENYDVMNATGCPLHKQYMRGQLPKEGEYMPVIHVWLRRSDGCYLIQQRAKSTDPVPYQWATTTGLPDAGETFLAAARRETKEELGLDLPWTAFKKVRTVITHGGRYRTITQVYLAQLEAPVPTVHPNPLEVRMTAYETLETIREKITQGTFWDYPVLLQDETYFNALEEADR